MALITNTPSVAVYVDDVPSSPVAVKVTPDSDEGTLDWATAAEATFTDPLGVTTPLETVTLEDGTVTVTWPTLSLFTQAGLGYLNVTLTGATAREGVEPLPIIVEARGRWLTTAGARRLWDDGPDDAMELWLLLDAAHTACVEFAPEIETEEPLLPTFLQAQLVQARNTWEAVRSGGTDSLGTGEFALPRHPLDWQVKQLLRPDSVEVWST